MENSKYKVPLGIVDIEENTLELFSENPSEAFKMFNESTYQDADENVSKTIRKCAENSGISNEKFNKFMSEFCALKSRTDLSVSIGKDKILIQAIAAFDEMTSVRNTFSMRMSEWFTLMSPQEISRNKELASKIASADLEKINYSGLDTSEKDKSIIEKYSSLTLNLYTIGNELEKYIKSLAKEVMPNFSSLTDTLLACRILSIAGSVERLSKFTSSSIQLAGAEKALFRHIKGKGKAPKYGIIFNDSRIKNADKEKQAKLARVLSSKLMIAVRIDYYSKRDDSEKLRKELEKEMNSI